MKIKDTKWLSWGIQLFYVLALVLICAKLSYGISSGMDIRFHDESIYLARGIHFSVSYLFADGFLYLTWYKLLSFLVKEPVALYYFNYIVLLVINPFLIYILLRKMRQERFISASFSIFFLVSSVNVTSWPFITRFALAIILVTLILIFSVKERRNKFLIAFFGLSLLVYTRPEYVLSLFIFSLAAIIYLLYRFLKTRRQGLLVILFLTLVLSVFIMAVKSPARANRSVMAFGQHYGVHLFNRGKISEDPNTNWRKIMKEHFQTDQSIMQAFLNNPGEMTNHLLANLRDIPYQAMQHFFPYNIENRLIKKILLAAAGILFLVLMMLAFQKIKGKPLFHKDHVDDTIFYWMALLIIIPLLVSMILIYPREHYLLVLFAVLLILAAKNVPAVPENWKFKWILPIIVLLVLYWIPWQVSGKSGIVPGTIESIHHKTCTNLKKIKFIRNLKVNSLIFFLGSTSMEPYIPGFKFVDPLSKNIRFNEYIEREHINMIEVNNGLINQPRFIADEEFKRFISGIPGDDWTRINIPGCGGYLAVKKSLLD